MFKLTNNEWIVISGLLMPLCNVLMAFHNDKCFSIAEVSIMTMLSIVMASIGEEIVFREIFQKNLYSILRFEVTKVIFIVNLLFAIFHCININSYASYIYMLVQSICAFCIGINLSLIYYIKNNIAYCAVIHVLINLTSLAIDAGNQNELATLQMFEVYIYIMVSLIYLFFSYKLLRTVGDGKN